MISTRPRRNRLLALVAAALLPTAAIYADEQAWPIAPDATRFAFANALSEIIAFDSEVEERLFNYRMTPRDLARIDSSQRYVLDRGSFIATGQGPILAARALDANATSIELLVHIPRSLDKASGSIVSLGDAFSLSQNGLRLELRINADNRPVLFADLPRKAPTEDAPGPALDHVVVRFGRDDLSLLIDGGLVAEAKGSVKWIAGDLVFGSRGRANESSPANGRLGTNGAFRGSIESFGFYETSLDEERANASLKALLQISKRRVPPESTGLEARLVAKSRVPTPDEIAPYRESLAVFEYEVVKVVDGFYFPKKIRVAHWVILDGHRLPFREAVLGQTLTLRVEPFAENRQLKTVNISETLELDFDLDLFFDAGGASLGAPE